MPDVICPLCSVVVDTIEDTERVNSMIYQRPPVRGFTWEVRDQTNTTVVRPNAKHECAPA